MGDGEGLDPPVQYLVQLAILEVLCKNAIAVWYIGTPIINQSADELMARVYAV